MRREWDTQTVHAVEIRSGTRCASCANDRGKIKGRKGGGPLDEAGVRAVVSPKEEGKEREGGGPVRGTRRESREPTGCWGKGATHNAQRRRALHDAAATRKRGAKDPIQTTFVGHAAKLPSMQSMVN